MDSQKNESSEIPSDENKDQSGERSNDDNTGKGRSYECTFCKRGFTNAQALGGHMNIHRKDKAKAKQQTHHQDSSLASKNIKSTEAFMSSRYFSPVSEERTPYYVAMGAQMNHPMHFQPSNPISPKQHAPHQRDISASSSPSEHFGHREHQMGANLCLRIGPISQMEDHDDCDDDERKGKDSKENEVLDLELRLGHDP